MRGWNAWYHVMGNTYGTWLRGDSRGWRERHHRKHVDGDYRRPPKRGTGDEEFAKSKWLMNRDPVRLSRQLRVIALIAIFTSLIADGIIVVIASLDDHHLHVLAKFPKHDPRQKMGWAKLHATKKVKEAIAIAKAHGAAVGYDLDLQIGEGIWAKRTKAEPVSDRNHQYNTVGYIYDHVTRGANLFMHPNAERWLRKMKKIK